VHFPAGFDIMPDKKDDPTKDPEFQKVVQAFLHTKPQPHKPRKKPKPVKPKKPAK
jgi:hypothetical protein